MRERCMFKHAYQFQGDRLGEGSFILIEYKTVI